LAGSLSAERDFLARGNEAGTSRLAMVVVGSRVVVVLQSGGVCMCTFGCVELYMLRLLRKDCDDEGNGVNE